jgi:rRNA maturation endonuclease Nob1
MDVRRVISQWWYRCSKCSTVNSSKTSACACGNPAIDAVGEEYRERAGSRFLWAVLTMGVSVLFDAITSKPPIAYFITCQACGKRYDKVPCRSCDTDHHAAIFTVGEPPQA